MPCTTRGNLPQINDFLIRMTFRRLEDNDGTLDLHLGDKVKSLDHGSLSFNRQRALAIYLLRILVSSLSLVHKTWPLTYGIFIIMSLMPMVIKRIAGFTNKLTPRRWVLASIFLIYNKHFYIKIVFNLRLGLTLQIIEHQTLKLI